MRSESMKRRLCLADRVPARESWFGRMNRHFHEHPQGRLHEILFWAGLGLAMGLFALFAWKLRWVATPFALLIGLVALCLFLWAFLPQKKAAAPPPLPKGKRGEIQKQRKEILSSRKPKGPGPPIT